ncbi:MAG: hypothetical protein AB1725_06410 [Armatimonadota bacterium]
MPEFPTRRIESIDGSGYLEANFGADERVHFRVSSGHPALPPAEFSSLPDRLLFLANGSTPRFDAPMMGGHCVFELAGAQVQLRCKTHRWPTERSLIFDRVAVMQLASALMEDIDEQGATT